MSNTHSDAVQALEKPETNEELEQRVFEIADRVAKECALSFIYSTFHVWEYFCAYPSDDFVSQVIVDNVWNDLEPYSHCVGHAYKVATRLRDALTQDEQLSHYAKHVQLLTEMPQGRATSEGFIHHVTALLLRTAAIVIDLGAHSSAFRVPLNECVFCDKDLPIEQTEPCGFQFAYLPGKGGQHLLLEPGHRHRAYCEAMKKMREIYEATGKYPPDETIQGFYPTLWAHLICQLIMRSPYMVGSKYISTEILLDDKPSYRGRSETPFQTPHGVKYITEGCQLSIRFIDRCLVMEVPYKDWLKKYPELLSRLEESRNFKKIPRVNESTATFTVLLHHGTILNTSGIVVVKKKNLKYRKDLKLMEELGVALGLPEGVVYHVAEAICDVWSKAVASG
ncbi:hypothetical protein BDV96DRAFT_645258 [Lophiotrema nucula]|uniref:Uncharacterized protein n=1 Tax=Lophiotrema nucula TaxID=690887 RepID=A0A6A5ZCS2_9PLEO|nr:hypothetical protein BDV96DRAFT_645258 [Lophiotrema nucula]